MLVCLATLQPLFWPHAGSLFPRGTVEVSPSLPVIACDRSRMLVVFRRLIDNALRFLGDQPEPLIEIGAREAQGKDVVVYVRDNGIGIDPRYHDRIFSLFERLDPQSGEGTGVGLALVERVVRVHGGRVWVESQGLDQGSTFCIALPQIRGRHDIHPVG